MSSGGPSVPLGATASVASGAPAWTFPQLVDLKCVIPVDKARVLGAVTGADGTALLPGNNQHGVLMWRQALFDAFTWARATERGISRAVLPSGAFPDPLLSGSPTARVSRAPASVRLGDAWVHRAEALDVNLILSCGNSSQSCALRCGAMLRLSFTFTDAKAAASGECDTVPVHVSSYAVTPRNQSGFRPAAEVPKACVHLQGVRSAHTGRAASAADMDVQDAANMSGFERRRLGAAGTSGCFRHAPRRCAHRCC